METSSCKLRTHFMRPLLLLLFGAVSAYCQPFSFGVKAGVPLTDFVNAASSSPNPNGFLDFATHTNRYIVGATGELHLPFHLGIEVDALYRHLDYQSTSQVISGTTTTTLTSTTGTNAWEFPILGKFRFGTPLLHPFVDAGVAWDTLQGLTQNVQTTITNVTGSGSSASTAAAQVANNTTRDTWSGRVGLQVLADSHSARSPLYALGREALLRPERLAQQQSKSGRVLARHHVLAPGSACHEVTVICVINRIRWIGTIAAESGPCQI